MKRTGITTEQLIYWGLFLLISITVTQLLLTLSSLSQRDSTIFSTQTAIESAAKKRVYVTLSTSAGDVRIRLLSKAAPVTVNNFVAFVESDFYTGTKFHRVVKDLLVQGGDPLTRGGEKSLYGTGGPGYVFQDEIVGLPMSYGTVAMSNRGKPNTNGSQFFIVTAKDGAPELEGKYTIFGQVEGDTAVLDAINSATVDKDGLPTSDIVLKRAVLR